MKRNIITFLAALLIGIFLTVGNAYANTGRNIILVLDTSMSMVGHGGPDIFSDVVEAVYRYIDRLEDGDRVTFVKFDAGTTIYPTVLVDDKNDRDILKKYISMTQAAGLWTHTYDMLKNVYELAAELEKENSTKTVIVIMTDGIDDPPPAARVKRVDLNDVFSGVGKVERFVYLVNFSDVKDTPWFQKLRDQIAGSGAETKLISAQDDPARGLEEAGDDMHRATAAGKQPVWPIVLIVLVVAVVAALIFYKRNAQLKVRGRLECWENTVLNPYIEDFDLTRRKEKSIYIGRGAGTMYHLNDMNVSSPFRITAVREKGEIKMLLDPGSGNEVRFADGAGNSFLEDGTHFQIANYTFKYIAD